MKYLLFLTFVFLSTSLQALPSSKKAKSKYSAILIESLSNKKAITLNKVKDLIKKGADVNATDEKGYTALYYAVLNNKIGVVKIFIETGVDTNVTDQWGHTVLHLAAHENYFSIVKILLDKGKMDINARSKAGDTALHYAFNKGNLFIVHLLLNRSVDVNVQNERGLTILHLVAKKKDGQKIIQMLLDKKVDINIKGEEGYTALHYAAEEGHLNNVKVLLKGRADESIRNNYDETAIDIAEESVKIYLEKKQEVGKSSCAKAFNK